MPFKIVNFKLMGIATADCEKTDLMSVRSGALVATFVYNLVYTYNCNNNLETAQWIFLKNCQTRG